MVGKYCGRWQKEELMLRLCRIWNGLKDIVSVASNNVHM